MWKPEEDGITHVNVYSKGATPLGQVLSNFAYTPFTCEDGDFNSIEAYWYWLGTPEEKRDVLRFTSGAYAKRLGKELHSKTVWLDESEFIQKICAAIDAKLKQYPSIQRALEKCELPLTHYYVYNGKAVEPTENKWVIRHLESKKGKNNDNSALSKL